jgi:mycofactocin precursor
MFIPVEQRPETPTIDVPTDAVVTPIAEIMARHPEPASVETPEVTEELLIEEVSIDGMCGVY